MAVSSQSSDVRAPVKAGAPVCKAFQSPLANLSASGSSHCPAKTFATFCCVDESRLTQNTRLVDVAVQNSLSRLTQTRMTGGSAQTEHMELTVSPARPPAPSVETMLTLLAAPANAVVNVLGSTDGLDTGLSLSGLNEWLFKLKLLQRSKIVFWRFRIYL